MENLQIMVDWANRDLISILLGFISAILVFFIGRFLARVLTRYATRSMERAKLDGMAISFLQTLIYSGTMVAVIIGALSQAGIQTTSFTALLASAGVAIGLALKDSLSNLASGLMILMFKPYAINNVVDAGGANGLVEEVQIFNTVLRTPDNIKVIIPNSAVINGSIKNYSAYKNRRISLTISIGYGDNLGSVRDLLMEIMTSHPKVLADPAPTVEVLELAASTVNLAVRSWALTEDFDRVRCDLLEQMKVRLDEYGVSLPYPQQIVHLQQSA